MPNLTINFSYKKIFIIGLIVIALLGLAAFFVFYFAGMKAAPPAKVPLAIDDQQPIWLLRDGQVAVYRQTEFYKDEVVSRVVIDNLSGQAQPDVKVYEVIPKEIAQSASELKFSAAVTVVEDDPIILWDLGDLTRSRKPVELNYVYKERLTTCGIWEKLEPGFKEQMKKNNLDPNSEDDCENYAHQISQANKAKRQQQQQAAQQKAAELQEKKEKITKVVQPNSDEYLKIAGQAKIAIAQESKKKEDKEKEYQKKAAQTGYRGMIYYSNNILPERLHEKILLREVRFGQEDKATCVNVLKPKEVLEGVYGETGNFDSNLFIEVSRYGSAADAQKVVKECKVGIQDTLDILGIISSPITYKEDQPIDNYYPFRIAYEQAPGQAGAGITAIENYVIIINSTTKQWLHNQEFYRQAITDIKLKMFGIDKRLAASTATPTPSASTPLPTSATPTPATPKPSAPTPSKAKTPEPQTPTPTPAGPVCGFIDMLRDYNLYTYTLNTSAKCSGYKNNFSARSISLRCSSSAASWRNYWVKEVEVAGLSKVRIKASLGLNDYSRFFTECSGVGVKYDDYSDIIVLSADPRSNLDAECNIVCSSADWPKCAVKSSGTGVLGQCGVSKCSASKKCDFEVSTSGLDKIYLVYHISDAWLADIEGTMSNLEICSGN